MVSREVYDRSHVKTEGFTSSVTLLSVVLESDTSLK